MLATYRDDDVLEMQEAHRSRRLPSMWKIAGYWVSLGTFEMCLSDPSCFACGAVVPAGAFDGVPPYPRARWDAASSWLERAHLVDRCDGGLDAEQNIVPLCSWCHRKRMPCFRGGTGRWAIAWVRGGGRWDRLPHYLQGPTREYTGGGWSWSEYLHGCEQLTGLSAEAAEECALAIDFTGRPVRRHG